MKDRQSILYRLQNVIRKSFYAELDFKSTANSKSESEHYWRIYLEAEAVIEALAWAGDISGDEVREMRRYVAFDHTQEKQ